MGGIPSGAHSSGFEGSAGVCNAHEVEGEVPDGCHVARAVALTQAGRIVAEGDVENPVEAVPDGPVVGSWALASTMPAWVATVFTKNRDRLLTTAMSRKFLTATARTVRRGLDRVNAHVTATMAARTPARLPEPPAVVA